MSFKFPFTNYHELNLTWVLDKLKELFEESAENVSVIENYNGRLTAVETELPTVSETASEASRSAAGAVTLAQSAKATADTAQKNAVQAQSLAGIARQEAQTAQRAADAATQAAQQAQATAQNFDGRITQAENDASQALEASRSFENRVQSAIITANNAARTATDAQGVAQNANQNAAAALDKIGDLSALDTTAKQNLVVAINEALENGGKVDSVNGQIGAVVLDAGDIGYNTTTVEDKLNDLTSDINTLNNSVSAIDVGYFKGVLAAELIQPGPAVSSIYNSRRIRKTKNKLALERTGSSSGSGKISVFSGIGTYQQISSTTLASLSVDDFIEIPLKFKNNDISLKTIFNPQGMDFGYTYNLIFYVCFANIVDNTINVVSTIRTMVSPAGTDRFIHFLTLANMRTDATHIALFIASGGSSKYGDFYLYLDSASSGASALALALDNN